MDENNSRLKPYVEALPTMARYSILIALILEACLFVLGRLFRAVLDSMGRVAITSGDWTFLFTSWQGLAIILLALFSLSVYVTLDLNAMELIEELKNRSDLMRIIDAIRTLIG